MSKNNMPKLPTPWLPSVRKGGILSEDAYTEDQMHAYARQYAEQRVMEERGALEATPEVPQQFASQQARDLGAAWAEGFAACRDAEYVGAEAEEYLFNCSITLSRCIVADQAMNEAEPKPGPP